VRRRSVWLSALAGRFTVARPRRHLTGFLVPPHEFAEL
jgi:hypothetical protein